MISSGVAVCSKALSVINDTLAANCVISLNFSGGAGVYNGVTRTSKHITFDDKIDEFTSKTISSKRKVTIRVIAGVAGVTGLENVI